MLPNTALIDAFPRLIVEIKQLANSNPDAAERRAKRLLDWVNRAYPIGSTQGFAMREELRLLLRDIRMARYRSGSSSAPTQAEAAYDAVQRERLAGILTPP